MTQKLFTKNEIVLCTYIARFGRDYFVERMVCRIENRSESSVKMKVQNIAAMLREENFPHSSEVAPLSGAPTGKEGRRTNWDIVKGLVNQEEPELRAMCKKVISMI